jgi:hypothetical protein
MVKPRVLTPLGRIVEGTKDFVKTGTSVIVNRTPDPLGKLPSWIKFTPKLDSIVVPSLYITLNKAPVVVGFRIWICVGTLPVAGVVTTTLGSGRLIVVLAVTKAIGVYVNCVADSPNKGGRGIFILHSRLHTCGGNQKQRNSKSVAHVFSSFAFGIPGVWRA